MNPSNEKFNDWVYRLKNSDEKAFDELFDATFNLYVKYAWHYTQNKQSSIDIVQDCFVKLWEKREHLELDKPLRTYIFRMVRNRSLNFLRDKGPKKESIDNIALVDKHSEPVIQIKDEISTLQKKLKNWISNLPERQNEAFVLSRFEGLTHNEIANVMNILDRTVNNHINKALDQLKACYNDFKKAEKNDYERFKQ